MGIYYLAHLHLEIVVLITKDFVKSYIISHIDKFIFSNSVGFFTATFKVKIFIINSRKVKIAHLYHLMQKYEEGIRCQRHKLSGLSILTSNSGGNLT